MINPEYVDGLEQRIKELTAERDAAVSTQDEMALAMFDINKARAVAEEERNALEAKWKNTGLPGRYESLTDDGHRLLGSREAVEHFRAQFSTLAAHVERFNELYRRATEEDAGWMTNSHVVKEYAAICRDTPETSLAKRDAEKQAEALEAAKTACIQIEEGQESLAWMHTKPLDDGEKVINENGIPYSNKALGAQHCVDEIDRMADKLRRQAGGEE